MWPFQKRPPTPEQESAEMVVILFEAERDKWETCEYGIEKGYEHVELGCKLLNWCGSGWFARIEDQRINLTHSQDRRIVSVIDDRKQNQIMGNLRSFAQKIVDRTA